jgi:hypothetical protein
MTISAVANVKGGLFGDSFGLVQLTQVSGRGSTRNNISRRFGRQTMLPLRQILRALDGVAPGATATKQFPTIDPSVELGGKRSITNNYLVNRATTAADQTETLNDLLTYSTRTTFGANPPPNKDGSPFGR